MTVEALKAFMLPQGPSQNQVLLEWDSIWTINKKIIDSVAPRLRAIAPQGPCGKGIYPLSQGTYSFSFFSFFISLFLVSILDKWLTADLPSQR